MRDAPVEQFSTAQHWSQTDGVVVRICARMHAHKASGETERHTLSDNQHDPEGLRKVNASSL